MVVAVAALGHAVAFYAAICLGAIRLNVFMNSRLPALRAKSNAEWIAAFKEWEGPVTERTWEGTMVDLFSPDYMSAQRKPWDTNPKSRRFIDLRDGELQVSEDLGDGSQEGRRFDPTTSANPVLEAMASPTSRALSFITKVPETAPPYAEVQNGALNFTVVLGKAFGKKVLKINTLYNGTGGPFTGAAGTFDAPGGEYNFWLYV